MINTLGAGAVGRVVLLIGMMGAGKSTVGRAIAARTGWPYVDNDELVRQATGREAPEVAAAGGEAALRAAESDALGRALALQPPAVAGVAGGVVLSPADRERLLAAGGVVWLRASLTTLAERVGSGEGRAWLQSDPEAALAALAAEREPYYAEVADAIVDVDDLTPEQAADAVIDLTSV
jgi:shikimate kinase